jgi:hypothetical protein
MEDLLLLLREDRQLEERLHAAVTLAGSKDSGDADDKKGKQRKSTANQASQNKACSVCGENHDVSQCPQEEARLNRDAYQRGNRMPGQASSDFQGRGGRGGSVAGAVVVEELAATTVAEGVAAATSEVQDMNLRLSRTVTKGKNASGVFHLDIKGNMPSTRLICVRKRLCLTPACKTPN